MTPDREEEIRKRAYKMWEREGSPEGREKDHWADAERDLSMGGSEAPATTGTSAGPSSPENKAADKPQNQGLNQDQKATTLARATAEPKLAASLS
jgi:hypothetical protein